MDMRDNSQTYLLTLASRVDKIRSLVIMVEEEDGRFSHHRAKFVEQSSWLNVVGNMEGLKHDILTKLVVWEPCNPDGSDIVEEA